MHEMTRRIWSWRSEIAFWSLWLGLVAAFIGLCVWVDHRYTLPFDKRITFGVQELYRYAWADRFIGIINDFGVEETIVLVLLVSFAVLVARNLRFEAVMVAGAGAVRYIQLIVRDVVHRPTEEYDTLRASFGGLFKPEFYPSPDGVPSGHVFGETIVYGLVFAYAGRALKFRPLVWLVRAVCVFEIALGGPARMYVGAHWFSDVVGAMLLAGIYLLLAWRIDRVVQHIRDVHRERALAATARLPATTIVSGAAGIIPASSEEPDHSATTPPYAVEGMTR
jgi:undecaprenyl-diphosphatase